MTLYIISAALLIGIGGLLWRGTKGQAYSVGNLERPISDLLNRGFNGGTLVINEFFGRRFIQVRKYICSDGASGIEIAFPKVAWSEQYFGPLTQFCVKEKLNFKIEPEDSERDMLFLYLNFGNDVTGVNNCISAIYTEIFAVKPSTKLFVCLHGASVT